MALERDMEGVAGHHELRSDRSTWELATGTLACPSCDAPGLPHAGPMAPGDPLGCGFCGHDATVRDFLSLGEPTRPARVVVRVSGLALR